MAGFLDEYSFVKRQNSALASAPRGEIASVRRVCVAPGSSKIHHRPHVIPRNCERLQIAFGGATDLPRLTEALEEQAKRIAHALHDDAGQLLAAIHIALDDLERELPVAALRLQTVRGLIARVEHQIRHVAHELRPTILDDLGLSPALEFLADSFREKRGGLGVTLEAAMPGRLPSAITVAVYRMVQEALTNVIRHAAATNVSVRVHADKAMLRCSVEDDGTGFDVRTMAVAPRAGLGLLGMRERIAAVGGTLRIASSPGAGTTLFATIPLETVDGDQGGSCGRS
jgi:signal transduction histidine kinase